MRKIKHRQNIITSIIFVICCLVFYFIPTSISPLQSKQTNEMRASARILSVDNTDLKQHGLLEFGSQKLEVELLTGDKKGATFRAANELRAQMELDKVFKPGDTAIVLYQSTDTPEQAVITAQDHDRSFWLILLSLSFCLLLSLFGGWTGIKALMSFLLSCFIIWKAVIPLTLLGYPASWTIFACVCLLTAVILFLIAGFTRKGIAAFLGATMGILAGLFMAHMFTYVMKINGAILPYSQALYYSGYDFLNLQDIFVGALILASSGAVMDLAMDISSGVEEVAHHAPHLPPSSLIHSGLRIGKSVVGTMTTTLLLAYSGGFITLLMMFYAQGTPPEEFINNPYVASEAVKTLIGSFSLVLVAPFTAIFAGILLHEKSYKL